MVLRGGKDPSISGIFERIRSIFMQRMHATDVAVHRVVQSWNSGDSSEEVTRDEFQRGVSAYLGDLDIPTQDLDACFDFFDRDCSGTISVDEFLVQILGCDPEAQTKLSQAHLENEAYQLSIKLQQVLLARQATTGRALGRILQTVGNNSERIDFHEFQQTLMGYLGIASTDFTPEALRVAFDFYDVDKNGYVNVDEFLSIILGHKAMPAPPILGARVTPVSKPASQSRPVTAPPAPVAPILSTPAVSIPETPKQTKSWMQRPHTSHSSSTQRFRCEMPRQGTGWKTKRPSTAVSTVMPDGSSFEAHKQVHFYDISQHPEHQQALCSHNGPDQSPYAASARTGWERLSKSPHSNARRGVTAGYGGYIPGMWEKEGLGNSQITDLSAPERSARVGKYSMAKLADQARTATPVQEPVEKIAWESIGRGREHRHQGVIPKFRGTEIWPISAVISRSVPSPSNSKGWGNRDVPGNRSEWSKKAADVNCGYPRKRTASDLEMVLRDKIRAKTQGATGQAFEAISLFDRKGSGSEIDPDAWHNGLKKLLNAPVTREETMLLFNKYDEDGGGMIDIFEFIEAMLPQDFPKRDVDIQYAHLLQTDRATRHANNVSQMLRTKSETGPTEYEGPKVKIPPGYCGHIPGFVERFACSYGQNALSSVTEPEKPGFGVYREVPTRGREMACGAFPGHMTTVRRMARRPGSSMY